LLDNDRRKIELANSLLFTLPGSPALYYGDEIGMGDNIWLPDRNGVRTPMQWTRGRNAGFSDVPPGAINTPVIDDDVYGPAQVNAASQQSDPESLFHLIRRMIEIRKRHPAFGRGRFEWVDCGSNAVAAYTRSYGDERLLIVNNLSGSSQQVSLPVSRHVDGETGKQVAAMDLLAGNRRLESDEEPLRMAPYQYLWLKLLPPTQLGPLAA